MTEDRYEKIGISDSYSDTGWRAAALVETWDDVVGIVARTEWACGALLRRVCVADGTVELLAAQGHPATLGERSDCSRDCVRQILDACASVAVLGPALGELGSVAQALAPGITRGLMLPLHAAEDECAMLVIPAGDPGALTLRDAEALQARGELLRCAYRNAQRADELRRLRESLSDAPAAAQRSRGARGEITIVGADAGLRPVMGAIDVVSRSDVPVLLLGETGTGKEVLARAIHARSLHRDGPFLRVNCGAIPSELIDSQLFGHERGSFTGASATHQGWFERADGGTLLLDEIGELPPAAQVRLLRVLQDGSLERVGGRRLLHVHVRIVAATHRDLPEMVNRGTFREDLWYRLAVFPIRVPPLRERPADIGELAAHFAARAAERFGMQPVAPTPADVHALRAYSWPGNVRELAAVIDRAVLLGDGRRLEVARALGLSGEVARRGAAPILDAERPTEAHAAPATGPSAAAEAAPAVGAGEDSLDGAMRAHIEVALRACLGRIDGPFGAARRLQINPHTLRARMRKLGVDWRAFRAIPHNPQRNSTPH